MWLPGNYFPWIIDPPRTTWPLKRGHTSLHNGHMLPHLAACKANHQCIKEQMPLTILCLFTRGQFWPSGIVIACVCVCVRVCACQSLACPRDNSGPVQARLAKFAPNMQKTLVKVPIVFVFFLFFFFFGGGGGGGGQLTLTFKVKFNLKVRIYPILSLSGP